MMTLEQWGVVCAIVLGLYGAGLSTLTFVNQRREQRAHVRPEVSWGMLVGTPSSSGPYVFVTAINDGAKPVILTDYGFRLPDDPRDRKKNMRFTLSQIAQTERPFPCELLPGANVKVWIGAGQFISFLRKEGFAETVRVEGYFGDQIGNHWRGGKMLKIDLNTQIDGA